MSNQLHRRQALQATLAWAGAAVLANRTERAISQVGESVTVIAEEEIISRQATDALDRLVEYCPNYAEGYNQRAFVSFLRQDFEAALVELFEDRRRSASSET